ncbi:MFS transporter [Kineococcus arenarius]|uniref:MFS transporter n=1 Tax=Kineococcus sp. SYSU DK007 TaxID=3383128 RepID=UPI003D7D3131
MAPVPGSGRRLRGRLLLLCGAVLLAVTGEMLPAGLLAVMADDLAVSRSAVAGVVSAYAVVVAVAAVPLTVLTARWPRRRLLLGCLVGFAVSNAAMASSSALPALIAARTLGGLTHAVLFSVVTGYATRLAPARLTGRAVSLVLAGGTVAFVLGVPLGTWLGSLLGWRTAFAALAVAAVLLVLATPLVLPVLPAPPAPDPPAPTRREGAGPAAAGPVEQRRYRVRSGLGVIAGFVLLIMLGHSTLYTYVSPVLLDAGLTQAGVGPALLLYGAAGLLGIWGAGRLADHRPRAGLTGFTAVLLLALVLLAAVAGRTWATVLVLPLWGAAYAGMPGFFMSAAVRASRTSPDTSAAVVNAASNAGIALGAFGGGQVITRAGVDALPLLAAVPVALALLVIAVRHRPADPSKQQETEAPVAGR